MKPIIHGMLFRLWKLILKQKENYLLRMSWQFKALQYGGAMEWSGNIDVMLADKAYAAPCQFGCLTERYTGLSTPMWAWATTDSATPLLLDNCSHSPPDSPHPLSPLLETPELTGENVSLVIVTYQDVADTLKCLASVYAMRIKPRCVVVVENGSLPSTAEALFAGWKELAAARNEEEPVAIHNWEEGAALPFRNVMLHIKHNNGYACGCNAGLRAAVSNGAIAAVWMLNNDIIVEHDTLEALCNKLNMRTDANMAVSIQVGMDNRDTLLCAGGGSFSFLTGVTRDIGKGLPLEEARQWPAERFEKYMDYACGASALLRRSSLDTVGFLEERYFLYYEDVEYSLRSQRNGFLFAVANNSVVYHKVGAAAFRDPRIVVYATRNRLDCVRKYRPWALVFALLHIACGMVKDLLRGDRSAAILRVAGIRAFFSGKWGNSDYSA